jgi:pSer/pThr/pTyr-binding forkhead associated (FHA) protein
MQGMRNDGDDLKKESDMNQSLDNIKISKLEQTNKVHPDVTKNELSDRVMKAEGKKILSPGTEDKGIDKR